MSVVARLSIGVAFLLACLSGLGFAQSPAHPVSTNLSWDQCAGDGYVGDRAFECNLNSGVDVLFASLVIHEGNRHGVVAVECVLDFTPTSAVAPDWWQVNSGMCRPFGISASGEIPDESAHCLPWYWEAAPMASTLFDMDYAPEGRMYARVGVVLTGTLATATLLAGQEYTLFKLRLTHSKSVGAGACTGCAVPTCIGLSWLNLERAAPDEDELFAGAGLNTVTWQGAYVAAYPIEPPGPWIPWVGFSHTNRLDCTLAPVPTRGRTWGLLKAMYR